MAFSYTRVSITEKDGSKTVSEIRPKRKEKFELGIVRIPEGDPKDCKDPESCKEPGDEMSTFLSIRKPYALFPHQIEAVQFFLRRETEPPIADISGGFLALEMGLGKTLISLVGAQVNRVGPTLIVCNKPILRVWSDDILKFFGKTKPFVILHKEFTNPETITPERLKDYYYVITSYDVVLGSAKKQDLLDLIVTRDERERIVAVKNRKKPFREKEDVSGFESIFYLSWGRIIADESHKFANPQTKIFHAMMCLFSKIKWCLTGTPIRNYTSDLYTQFRFLGLKALEKTAFNRYYYMMEGLDQTILNMNYIEAGIVLPEKEKNTIFVEMDSTQREFYQMALAQAQEAYEDFDNSIITWANMLVMFLRLRQICLAPSIILNAEKKEEYASSKLDYIKRSKMIGWLMDRNSSSTKKSAKVLKIVDIVSSIPKDQQILIFTLFCGFADICVEVLEELYPGEVDIVNGKVAGLARQYALDKFKRGKTRILVTSYKVCSEGLNLTEANNVILSECYWTPVTLRQAIARSHRIGQTKKVKIWYLLIRKSIEEYLEKICADKAELIEEFFGNGKKTKSMTIDKKTMKKILFHSEEVGAEIKDEEFMGNW